MKLAEAPGPVPVTKNEHHADDLAVPDHHPPWLLPAPLLLYLSEGIDLGSSRLKLRPDGSLDQSSPLGPLRQDRLFLSCLMAWVLTYFGISSNSKPTLPALTD